jgi:archaetidylinositol phosphate synthase
MAISWFEFCEPANPQVLSEVRDIHQFRNADRIQRSLTAKIEQRVLVWMAERTPNWIGPDHLTILGFVAQVMVGTSYALARRNRFWLLAVVGFLALNWLGDSLDGTLARVRKRQRKRYGFYVDHMVDSFGALALMGGLAISGYMHPYVAIGLLTAFLLLSIQSYLATYTLGEFRLSFWCFGPTEIRMLLAIGNLALLYHPTVLGERYRLFNVGGTIAIVGMTFILLFATASNTCRLYREESRDE